MLEYDENFKKIFGDDGLNKMNQEEKLINKMNELYNNLDKVAKHNFRNNILTYFAYQINEFENCLDFKGYYYEVLHYSIPNVNFKKLINLHNSKNNTKEDFMNMILLELENLNLPNNDLNNDKVIVKSIKKKGK